MAFVNIRIKDFGLKAATTDLKFFARTTPFIEGNFLVAGKLKTLTTDASGELLAEEFARGTYYLVVSEQPVYGIVVPDDSETYELIDLISISVVTETSCVGVTCAQLTAAVAHSNLTSGNPHAVTKLDVGLGSVDDVKQLPFDISTLTAADPPGLLDGDMIAVMREGQTVRVDNNNLGGGAFQSANSETTVLNNIGVFEVLDVDLVQAPGTNGFTIIGNQATYTGTTPALALAVTGLNLLKADGGQDKIYRFQYFVNGIATGAPAEVSVKSTLISKTLLGSIPLSTDDVITVRVAGPDHTDNLDIVNIQIIFFARGFS